MVLRKDNNLGGVFMEYAIILGVASLVLATMNTYIKRGAQGRIKDMSDYFISEGSQVQEGEANAGAITTSNSASTANSNYNIAQRLGGARTFVLEDNTDTTGESRSVEDKKIILPESSIAPEDGVVPIVPTEIYGGKPGPESPSPDPRHRHGGPGHRRRGE